MNYEFRGGLILTRRPMETIHIGDDIVITFLEAKGRQMRIHIAAPKHLPIVRGELLERDKCREDSDGNR